MLARLGWAADPPTPGRTAPTKSADDPKVELQKLDAADDAAQAEVDEWVRSNKQKMAEGAGLSDAELQRRISERFAPVRRGYDDFLKRYPRDAAAHLAYGNFLNARDDEHGAQAEWEKALELDTNNAAIYNNLAGRYGESGPVEKAFQYFTKAIELSPNEPVYYHNFADVLYVLRKKAVDYYHSNEQDVFGRCLVLYSNALRLDPKNFAFARDLAQTCYSIRPFPVEAALQAWTNALEIARQEDDRQDVYVHLARVKMLGGHFAESRAQLTLVTNQAWLKAKTSLLQSIEQREAAARAVPGDKQ
jgi:tetratricopeptide (TPR) repeat protein